MSRVRAFVASVRHLRVSQAGHALVRAIAGDRAPGRRGPVPASVALPPLPPEAARPIAAARDRVGAEAATPDEDRARRVLAAVTAPGGGAVPADPGLLSDLAALARRPPWDDRGLALARAGVALHRGGAAFSGAAARAWRARGASILSTCAADQVLPDGLHVERSPVRHAQLLELLLIASSTADARGEAPPQGVREAADRLAATLPQLVLPDGELLRVRDGAPGEALPLDRLLAWAARSPGARPPPARPRAARFPAAGCAILTAPDGRSAVTLWAAPPCPPDRPLDRHADALSTEIVLDGFRVIATAGTTTAEHAPSRERERRPGAFAGLLVDGVGTSSPPGAAGRGARGWARRLEAREDAGGAFAEAYAGGLDGPARGVVLRRVVYAGAGPCVVVVDEAAGRGEHELAFAWPLAPGLAANLAGDGAALEGLGRTFAFTAPGLAISGEDGLAATGPGIGARRAVLWTRARRVLPTRVVHAFAPGGGPLRATATVVPGGELRLEVEGPAGRCVGFVPLGRRP